MPGIVHSREKKGQATDQPTLLCPVCGTARPPSQTKRLLALEKAYIEQTRKRRGWQPSADWAQQVARLGYLTWACDVCLAAGRVLSAERPGLQETGMSLPDLVFADLTLRCTDCGQEFVFEAQEQRYWYETLQFVRHSVPKQCAACRRKRRLYKRYFHDLGRALAALDPHDADQLQQVAELYAHTAHYPQALEYLRRAKNRARSEGLKAELQAQIKQLQETIAAQALTEAEAER